MKLGVLTNLFSDKTLEETLQYLSQRGVQMAEIGVGGFPGNAHGNPEVLLNDKAKLQEFQNLFKKYKIEISALSVHGNPIHPNKAVADKFHHDFVQAVLLAEKLGLKYINTFSGCPGGSKNDQTPNWVTCPWPNDFLDILEYQWNEVLIPYWKETVAFAKSHGVTKIGLEMHPGFCVYNPETLLKLRNAVGPEIGANFDPSHLIWQGIDPVLAIKQLGDAIHHFHAKDTKIDAYNVAQNGVLDTKRYDNELARSWVFRTVGYGNNEVFWRDVISALRLIGYDYAVSIEHEDSLMSNTEGLNKAISFLTNILIYEKPTKAYWI
ncbi:MAG: xylose isomerase [Haloplasmataceae bacterium]|jgi:sugar phosphate isomerase/epimerase|nr:xylose isomerase [Haloplasmataceae bacterium]